MTRTIVFSVLLGLLNPLGLGRAGEFAVINQEITFTDSSSGFYFWYSPTQGPTNWLSPDNYYNGQFYCRFEVISQPTSTPSYLSFCIWENPTTPGSDGAGQSRGNRRDFQ